MMYGIMILSIHYMLEDKFFKSAALYAVLLNFKHIFLYFAPAYGIMYIKYCVLGQKSGV